MLDRENTLNNLDISIVCILFIVGCFIGKLMMNAHDIWIAFNGPAFGILALGELIWWWVRKILR